MFANHRKCCQCAAIVSALCLPQSFAWGLTIVRVDGTSGSASPAGLGNGWGSNAYLYLQDGLARANTIITQSIDTSVQIWVRGASGSGISYRPDQGAGLTSGDRNLSFALRNSVAIYGGFNGSGDDELSDRDPYNNITILTGDLAASQGQIDSANFGNRSDNSIHVVRGSNVNASARLDGFRIRGGNADGSGTNGLGGGMLLEATSASIIRCVFTDNQAQAGGGAHAEGTLSPGQNQPNLVNCAFLGNKSDGVAGGMCNNNAVCTIVNTVFSGNEAVQAGGFFAGSGEGAITDTTLINCTFTQNSASDIIGAIQVGTTCTIRNSIFWGDSPTEIVTSPFGSTLTVTHSNVQGGWTGTGNINSNPLFTDADGTDGDPGTTDDDVRLGCTSPSVNAGLGSWLPADTFDLDLDPNTTILPIDLDASERRAGEVDQGAYERPGTCCSGDTNLSGAVDINDLLNVINTWGMTGTPIGDVDPNPCPDGVVNINDLLLVINSWGNCGDHCPGDGFVEGGIPQDYNDCNNACSQYSGQEWAECMQACFRILCENGQDEYCDD